MASVDIVTSEFVGTGRELTDVLIAWLAIDGKRVRKVTLYLSEKDFMATRPTNDRALGSLWDRAASAMIEQLVQEITAYGVGELDNPIERCSDLASSRLDHPSGLRTPGAVLAAFEI